MKRREKEKRCAQLRDDIEISGEVGEKMYLVPWERFVQIRHSFES